jgi:transcriptional regulator with XRE-family HTH domain
MDIGNRMKELRIQYGLTQQELADRAELTKGFISQLERNQNTPSISTLLDIIQCLGTTPAEFFADEEPEQIVFKEADYFEKIDEERNSLVEWVVPNAQKNAMEPVRLTLKPGGTSEVLLPHAGEEFGYVLSGRLIVHLNDSRYSVEEGQSFYYPADRFHRIENPGNIPAVFLWISTPPSF